MNSEIRQTIDQLNTVIKSQLWCDFFIVDFNERNLIVRGTQDATYGFNLEIEFQSVLYVDAPTQWKTNTKSDVVFKSIDSSDIDEKTQQRYFDNGSGVIFAFQAELFSGLQWVHVVASTVRFVFNGTATWPWTESQF
jgi:hypothetical protein